MSYEYSDSYDWEELIDTLNNQVNKISDLKAKLAEMTKKYNACQEARKLEIEFSRQDKEELKQQLFESGLKTLEEIKLSEQRKKMLEDLSTKNWELEQQLAEKDKNEKQFKTMYFNKCLDYEHLHEKFDDKCAEFELKEYDYKQTIFEKEQDKIEFAIAELEKVRDWCIGINENNKMYGFQKEPNLENCADIAQNRINDLKQQLTHQHEDKGD